MQFKRIMERARIKGRLLRDATGAGRSQSSLSFHSLRHSFNAALANAGVGVELRQELVGHSSLEMNKLYTHPDIEVKRKACVWPLWKERRVGTLRNLQGRFIVVALIKSGPATKSGWPASNL
jgi:integrase